MRENIESDEGANMETVVSGSFRKHMEQVGMIIENFRNADVKVLAPATQEVINPDDEFVILATDDQKRPPHKLEMDFMREMRKADFLYVADVGGYVGQSAATEMAYARLKRLPIVATGEVRSFSDQIPEEARSILLSAISKILPMSDISKERIMKLKEELNKSNTSELSKEESRILLLMIKKLLNDLEALS